MRRAVDPEVGAFRAFEPEVSSGERGRITDAVRETAVYQPSAPWAARARSSQDARISPTNQSSTSRKRSRFSGRAKTFNGMFGNLVILSR
jgi:hypothetical protein